MKRGKLRVGKGELSVPPTDFDFEIGAAIGAAGANLC